MGGAYDGALYSLAFFKRSRSSMVPAYSNAGIPVMALPRISVWISLVPS